MGITTADLPFGISFVGAKSGGRGENTGPLDLPEGLVALVPGGVSLTPAGLKIGDGDVVVAGTSRTLGADGTGLNWAGAGSAGCATAGWRVVTTGAAGFSGVTDGAAEGGTGWDLAALASWRSDSAETAGGALGAGLTADWLAEIGCAAGAGEFATGALVADFFSASARCSTSS